MAHQSSQAPASVTSFTPEKPDTLPSDKQPPGVDEEVDYDSLEAALTGSK